MESFLRTHRNGTVFVATDSPSFLAEVRARWLARWPASAFRWRDVLRAEENVAFSRGGKGSRSSNARKGEEVLLDALLLSRCDYLLEWCSWEEVPPFRSPPRKARDTRHTSPARCSASKQAAPPLLLASPPPSPSSC